MKKINKEASALLHKQKKAVGWKLTTFVDRLFCASGWA